ncbi:ErpL protein [Borreliella japonica]|uniref:ErpL protein n=1 Tax=Borreliella japonica TaxID=34095 RepID=UPI003AF19BBC
MNKKMFIICSIFALIISCKNDVNGKDLETSEQKSLEISKQIEQEIKKEFNGLLNILETKDLSTLDTSEIEKTIKDLKDKVDKSDAKTTSLKTYSEYEEKVKEIKEKLKGKGNFEDKLKGLEDSLKKKRDDRRKALEEARQTFQGYKGQVDTATGETQGHRAQNQRGSGAQAWTKAREYGLSVSYSNGSGTDTSDMSSGIIDEAIKQIDEELKNNGEEAEGVKK